MPGLHIKSNILYVLKPKNAFQLAKGTSEKGW